MFERMKIATGVDFSKLLDASDYAVGLSTRHPSGRIRLVEDRQHSTIHFSKPRGRESR